MRRYGVSTIARWLGEELPQGVTAYIEHRGRLFELLRLEASNSYLTPVCRTLADNLGEFKPFRRTVTLDTRIILSVSEKLAGVSVESIEENLVPAATNSWALNLLARPPRGPMDTIGADEEAEVPGLHCG